MCAGITGLLVGIGIGIGFGALIFNPFRAGKVGGGLWFGKKRRKRGVQEDDDEDLYDTVLEEDIKVVESIARARHMFEDD